MPFRNCFLIQKPYSFRLLIVVLNSPINLLFGTQVKRIHNFWRSRGVIFAIWRRIIFFNEHFSATFWSPLTYATLCICYFASQNFFFIKDLKKNNTSQSLNSSYILLKLTCLIKSIMHRTWTYWAGYKYHKRPI